MMIFYSFQEVIEMIKQDKDKFLKQLEDLTTPENIKY